MNRLSDPTYQDFYNRLFEELKIKIASESDDYIIAQPTEDLVKYYSGFGLNPIEFDHQREESIDHKKSIKTIRASDREWGYEHEGDLSIESEAIIVKLPIIPNRRINDIMALRTQTISISGGPQIVFNGNFITIEIEIKGYRIDISDDQIANRILGSKTSIAGFLEGKNYEIGIENERLCRSLTHFIEERKLKLDADKERLQRLLKLTKIPLARKDEGLVKNVQVQQKPFVNRIRPKTPTEDYQLDRDKVLDIIRLISSQCLQFEKTPKTYSQFDETNLRDLLLSNLNSIFEGKATGETFNNRGKTDIYLNIDKGNILIAECKYYGGKKVYHETIDQILGYLTWRQNYGIIINFCIQKNFSKVLAEGESIIKEHTSYESNFKTQTVSHLISRHTLPFDEYKYVEIHHLYYNLFMR